jgi:hypothetical protein
MICRLMIMSLLAWTAHGTVSITKTLQELKAWDVTTLVTTDKANTVTKKEGTTIKTEWLNLTVTAAADEADQLDSVVGGFLQRLKENDNQKNQQFSVRLTLEFAGDMTGDFLSDKKLSDDKKDVYSRLHTVVLKAPNLDYLPGSHFLSGCKNLTVFKLIVKRPADSKSVDRTSFNNKDDDELYIANNFLVGLGKLKIVDLYNVNCPVYIKGSLMMKRKKNWEYELPQSLESVYMPSTIMVDSFSPLEKWPVSKFAVHEPSKPSKSKAKKQIINLTINQSEDKGINVLGAKYDPLTPFLKDLYHNNLTKKQKISINLTINSGVFQIADNFLAPYDVRFNDGTQKTLGYPNITSCSLYLNNINQIGENFLSGCHNIKKFTLKTDKGNNFTSNRSNVEIGSGFLTGCKKLQEANLLGVQKRLNFGEYSFEKCEKLSKLTFNSNVSLGGYFLGEGKSDLDLTIDFQNRTDRRFGHSKSSHYSNGKLYAWLYFEPGSQLTFNHATYTTLDAAKNMLKAEEISLSLFLPEAVKANIQLINLESMANLKAAEEEKQKQAEEALNKKIASYAKGIKADELPIGAELDKVLRHKLDQPLVVSVKSTQADWHANLTNFCQAAEKAKRKLELTVDCNGYGLPKETFKDMKHLTKLTIKNCTGMGYGVCEGCENLTDITIEGVMEAVPSSMFYGCENLISVSLPDGIKKIYNHAFYKCKKLMSFSFGKDLESIGEGAFSECSALQKAIFKPGLKTIEKEAFYECEKLTSILFPEGLETVGEEAFHGCSALQNVVFKPGLKTIGKKAFRWCKKLTSMIFPEGLETVGENAFDACSELQKAIFKPGLKILGKNIFEACKKITSITLPASIEKLAWLFGEDHRTYFSAGELFRKDNIVDLIIDFKDARDGHFNWADLTKEGQDREKANKLVTNKNQFDKMEDDKQPKIYYEGQELIHGLEQTTNPHPRYQLAKKGIFINYYIPEYVQLKIINAGHLVPKQAPPKPAPSPVPAPMPVKPQPRVPSVGPNPTASVAGSDIGKRSPKSSGSASGSASHSTHPNASSGAGGFFAWGIAAAA